MFNEKSTVEKILDEGISNRRHLKKEGKIDVLDESQPQEVAKKMRKIMNERHKEEFSWRRCLISCGFLLLTCGSGMGVFLAAYSNLTAGFPYYEVSTETEKLLEIFHSGHPYLVYCGSESRKVPPAIFVEGARENGWKAQTAVLDCDQKLPSGLSINQKYKLKPNMMPAFVVANTNKPAQLPQASLQSPTALSSFIDLNIKPKVRFFKGGILEKSCNKRCIVLGFKGSLPSEIRQLVEKEVMPFFRSVRVIAADLKHRTLPLDVSLNAEKKEKFSLLCLRGKEPITARFQSLAAKNPDISEIKALFHDCVTGQSLIQIPSFPEFKNRPKKVKPASDESPSESASGSSPVIEVSEEEEIPNDGFVFDEEF